MSGFDDFQTNPSWRKSVRDPTQNSRRAVKSHYSSARLEWDQRQGAKALPGEYQAASRGSSDASVPRIMAAEPATPVRTNGAIMVGRTVFMFVLVLAFTCLVELARLGALPSACWGISARALGAIGRDMSCLRPKFEHP